MLKILVPTDFSECAKEAFLFAKELAESHASEILVLNATFNPVQDEIFDPDEVALYQTDVGRYMSDKLNEQMSSFIGEPQANITTEIKAGEITRLINNYIAKEHYNLVVCGSHGSSGLQELLVGSTAEKIIRSALCPVFTIHKMTDASNIKKIAFATDFKLANKKFIAYVKMLQHMFNAHLYFVKINTPNRFEVDAEVLENASDFINTNGFSNCSFRIYSDYSVEEGIKHYANSIEADCIALGTNGYQGLHHIFSGSIAENVANHSSKLVWTYKTSKNLKAQFSAKFGQAIYSDSFHASFS